MQQNNPQPSIDRIGPWLILISVCAGLLVLASDFLSAVVTVLLEPTFLRGFGLMLLQVVVLSAIGSGAGFAVAELALCNEWVTQSMIRFLRVGRWLPFFVVWAAPVWRISWSQHFTAPPWTEPVFQIVIAMFPFITFTACYIYLSSRYTLRLERRTATFATFTFVLLDALLISTLLQVVLYNNGWQWFSSTGSHHLTRPTAAVLLLGSISFLLLRINGLTFEKVADISGRITDHLRRHRSWISFSGAGLLWFFCFALWDRLYVIIRDTFYIAPVHAVGRAGYRLLTTGSVIANWDQTIWPDMAASAQELAQGLLLSSAVALVTVKMLRVTAGSVALSYGLHAITHTVPIVLAIGFLPWIGVGHWFKVVTVAAVSCLPLIQTLWGLREQPFSSRALLALDTALPYAFLGMLFGELYASTAGLGFFILVALAHGNRTEALATSMFTLGLMVAVSLALRFAAKIVSTSRAEEPFQRGTHSGGELPRQEY